MAAAVPGAAAGCPWRGGGRDRGPRAQFRRRGETRGRLCQAADATGQGWSDSQTLTTYAAGECNGKTSCSVNLWVRDPIKADEVQVGYVCVSGDHRMPVTVLNVPVKKELAEAVLFCR